MVAGNVTVQLVENVTTTSLDTAITTIRASVGANGKILMDSVHNGQDMFVVGIEEA